MKKYNVIRYRLKQNTKPCDVLETLEALFKKHSAFFTECLFRVNVLICAYEFDGKPHSNRNRNAVNTLLKRNPELQDYYRYIRSTRNGIDFREDICIDNFSDDDFCIAAKLSTI